MRFEKTDGGFNLNISEREMEAIQKIIPFLVENLDDELSIRTGFSIQEYKNLQTKIVENSLSNKIFDDQEIIMLHQSLNEVCNGIHIGNFEDTIGLTIKEAKSLLISIEKII